MCLGNKSEHVTIEAFFSKLADINWKKWYFLSVHSQYVWNKSALVWHVTTEARKWGDHLPEVPAGHLSGNPRDPNIPLLLILRYILCVLYISLFFLFVRVGNPRNPNIPLFLVRFICGSFYLYFFWLKVPAGILWTQIFPCSSLFALYNNH